MAAMIARARNDRQLPAPGHGLLESTAAAAYDAAARRRRRELSDQLTGMLGRS